MDPSLESEQWICDECVRPSCIWPDVCRNLDTDHTALLDVYKAVRETPGVNHAFVTLHIDNLRGENAHHQCETVFKAFGRALRMAAELDPRAAGTIPSTKGSL